MRPCRSFFLSLAAAALVFATGPAEAARDLSISVTPEPATFDQEVVVTVTGDQGICFEEALGPAALETRAGGAGEPLVVQQVMLQFDDRCALPVGPRPFSVSRTVGRLAPGVWEVVVVDRGLAGNPKSTAEVTVYARGGGLDLEMPAEPVTDAEPLRFVARGLGADGGARLGRVEGNVIEVLFDDECPLLEPGLRVVEDVIDVGPLPAGTYEVRMIDVSPGRPASLIVETIRIHDATRCVPSPTSLCLQDGRFRAEVEWADFAGNVGSGRPVTLPGRDDSGLFWFFDEKNVELTVKVLDGCPVNGHHWVFVSSGSTVGYEIAVIDTATGQVRHYGNGLGVVPSLVADTAAFATCP